MPRRARINPDHLDSTSVEQPTMPAEDAPVRREGLAEEILRLLEERGVPSGAWLVDIAQARSALREADALLRRLEDAIVRTASAPRLDAR
jgi:hypothetical protein